MLPIVKLNLFFPRNGRNCGGSVDSQLKSFNGAIVGSFSSVSFVGAFDLILFQVRLRCRLHRQAQRHDPINNAPNTDWNESVPS